MRERRVRHRFADSLGIDTDTFIKESRPSRFRATVSQCSHSAATLAPPFLSGWPLKDKGHEKVFPLPLAMLAERPNHHVR